MDESPFQVQPLTLSDLISQFTLCGIEQGQTISVHATLSSLGWVVGGAETVIRALFEIVGSEGTLMMPAQTWKNLDPSTGVHWEQPEEWWPIIREHWPAFDPEVTPSINMGVIAEMFRTWPGTVRSNHPARSFAANGPNAEFLMKNHDLKNIFGEGSPLHKLYELDGHILLLGVGHDKNTSLHLAETRADFHGKHMVKESSAVMVNGHREWMTYETLAVEDADFKTLGDAFEAEYGIKRHRVGNADVRFIRQRPLVDWAVRWMEKNR
ncbi:MAG: AAC(3) family N-acetyltransferase [Bacteroidetes bacterium]|nr:AAC(3) family N-acetyltransferase [Bacteroidota bacterium]